MARSLFDEEDYRDGFVYGVPSVGSVMSKKTGRRVGGLRAVGKGLVA
jgi:hypothetical protein